MGFFSCIAPSYPGASKLGERADYRSIEYPAPSHEWPSALLREAVDFFTIVILDDKEVAMIDSMLDGRRGEGWSAYNHLAVFRSLENIMIRAYVRLGEEVEGHMVGATSQGGEGDVGYGLHSWFTASYF